MWLSLSRNQRLTLGMIAIAAVVVLIGFITMSRPSEYQVAFANLKEEDAAAIVTKLKEAKIPYELAERGTIKVPAAQVQEVKLMIAASGVVKQGGGAGFEIFAQPHFGLTEFAEKINYQRALEGELGRSIGRLDAVEAARVHLTLPEQSLFVSQKKDPTAAAVVQLKSGPQARRGAGAGHRPVDRRQRRGAQGRERHGHGHHRQRPLPEGRRERSRPQAEHPRGHPADPGAAPHRRGEDDADAAGRPGQGRRPSERGPGLGPVRVQRRDVLAEPEGAPGPQPPRDLRVRRPGHGQRRRRAGL